jgi:hypothetical protein
MDKISIISNLQQIADTLDNKNLFAQAEKLTNLMVKIAQDDSIDPELFHVLPDNKTGNNGPKLKDIVEPDLSDVKPESNDSTVVKINGETIKVPSKLTPTRRFDKKVFNLNYDPKTKQIFYKSEDGKDAIYLDKEGNVKETNSKRYDAWKQLGGRGLFGDWRLPNLNKSIPIEPYLRKELIPDVARIVKPVGNVVKDLITKPITDATGAIADDLNIGVPGRDEPFEAAAKFELGPSKDGTPVSRTPIKDSTQFPGLKLPDIQGGPKPVEPSAPKKTGGGSGGSGSSGGKNDIKISKDQLKDIQSPDDLLFWSMMVGNNIQYSKYDNSKENEYYSPQNKSNTLNYINKLTSSSYVERINPRIKKFKNEAIEKLNTKTAGKNMNRQILASMNEICEELDELGMSKAASEITDMMVKLAQFKKVTVCLIDGKPAVKIEGRKKPIFGPASGPFTSASHARNYAARVSSNYIDEIPANVMPGRSWRNQGPTGKPWTKDDEEMFDFEASREDKF